MHPGAVPTDLGRDLTDDTMNALIAARGQTDTVWKTVPGGAATSVWAGFVGDPEEIGGSYCEDCHVAAPSDDPLSPSGVRSYALDPDTAKDLWYLSEELVGESFPLTESTLAVAALAAPCGAASDRSSSVDPRATRACCRWCR